MFVILFFQCVFAHGEKDLRVKVAPGGRPPRLVSPNPPSYVEAMEPSWLNTENQFVPPPRAVQWPARKAKQQHSVINTPVNYLDDEVRKYNEKRNSSTVNSHKFRLP